MVPGLKKKWSPDKNLAPARPPEANFLSGGQYFFPGPGFLTKFCIKTYFL